MSLIVAGLIARLAVVHSNLKQAHRSLMDLKNKQKELNEQFQQKRQEDENLQKIDEIAKLKEDFSNNQKEFNEKGDFEEWKIENRNNTELVKKILILRKK